MRQALVVSVTLLMTCITVLICCSDGSPWINTGGDHSRYWTEVTVKKLAARTKARPRPYEYGGNRYGFVEPYGFQLFSMGPDGKPNTDDDVCSWE